MRLTLVTFILVILNGCSSIQSAKPLTQKVTATAKDDTKQILWLDERVNDPERLTQLVLVGDSEQYQTEYRWKDGTLREIERLRQKRVDGELEQQVLQIRYDKNGQANYQKYLVNDEILPLNNTQLTRYYKEAEATLNLAHALIESNEFFFQGYIQHGKISQCVTEKNKLLTISDPLYASDIFDDKKQFLAAVGPSNFVRDVAEVVILLAGQDYACITRPEFNQGE